MNAPQPRESPAFRRGEEVNPEDLPLRESVRLLPRVRVPAGQKRTAALVCCVGVQRTGAALRYGWWGRPWGGPGVVHLNVGPGQEQVAPLRVNWEGGEIPAEMSVLSTQTQSQDVFQVCYIVRSDVMLEL